MIATPLSRRHRRTREQWSRAHLRWTQRQWSTVLYTNESVFRLSRAVGRTRVWRRKNERFADCNIIERDPYGGGSVMVWAGISNNFKTHLVIINGTNVPLQVNVILTRSLTHILYHFSVEIGPISH